MTYVALCKRHDGKNSVRWIHGCKDFWEAVEKARFIPRPQLPLPPKPEAKAEWDHLHAAAVHEWNRECTTIRLENDRRIAEVMELKLFMGGHE